VRHSKNNSVKTNKDRHILSAAHIFGRDSSFWKYKVCADIRWVSLEKKTLQESGVALARLEHLFWLANIA